MGSIRKAPRTGRWEARYRDPAGRSRTRTFDLKADARACLSMVETDLLRGGFVDPDGGRVLFDEYAEVWRSTKADVAPRTLINIEGRLLNHIVPYFGGVPLGRIQPLDVRVFVAELVAAGLSPSTVKAIYLTCAQVFTQAAIDGLIARSPCIGIDLPRERHHEEMHFLTPTQVGALAETIDGRYRTLIYTAAYGGLRAGELHALAVRHLNLLAGTADVVDSTSEVRGELVVGPTKTGKRRTIAVPRFLADMLGEHIGRYPSSAGYVFSTASGGPVRHRNFMRRHFRPAVARAGLPDGLRFHDLRHTCAALLIADGRHMEEVKDHLGHSSIRVTSDRYGHLFPKARQALADGLDAIFRDVTRAPVGTRNAISRGADVVQRLPERPLTRRSGGQNPR